MTTTKKSPKTKVSANKTSAKSAVVKANNAVDEVQAEITEQANSLIDALGTNMGDAQNFARQIWYASLGVVGRSVEEVQSRLDQTNEELRSRYAEMNNEVRKMLEELVVRGERVQDDTELRLKEGRASIEEQIDKQIELVRTRLSGLVSVVDIPAHLQNVSNRLEALSKNLKKTA